jgi:glycosyltransferase involved in cell wall biosynthesis
MRVDGDGHGLRVAMVAARAHPMLGGIETHVHEVAGRLAGRGVAVTVHTTDLNRELPTAEEVSGYRIIRHPAGPRDRDYYLSPSLTRAVRRIEADVVHVQGVHTFVAPAALWAAQRAGVPSVLTFHTGGHSSRLRERMRSAQWRTIGPLVRKASARVAVCQYEIDEFSRILGLAPDRFCLVRNGSEALPVDVDGAVAAALPSGDPLVLSIGRLEHYKGHHRVIAALPALLRQAPGAHLVLVGSGPYEDELRELAASLGVACSVSYRTFGPGERGALGTLVARADVVTLLSEYEAHPVAVMEALGLARPVVVADTSGLHELGESGLVSLVPLDAGAEHVASALLREARGNRWAGGPPPLPTWDDCADSLLDLYRDVSHAPPAPSTRPEVTGPT